MKPAVRAILVSAMHASASFQANHTENSIAGHKHYALTSGEELGILTYFKASPRS